jgi:16S rRNA (uracil1498-N3)-methyltransferase
MANMYMSQMAKSTPRLFLDQRLESASDIPLAREQAHYVLNVLRMNPGDALHVFNANDGEWLAYLTNVKKKDAHIRCERRISDVTPPPDIDYLFAPLKHARLDYMVQKATELGARRLRPVITGRTIAERVNLDRMRANAIEAAEQCNLVFVPEVLEPVSLNAAIRDWAPERTLIYCDETATITDPIIALADVKPPAAILVGPEGGFTEEERAMLKALPYVRAISLGPRIMRADTVAIAALALVQAAIGDWKPSNKN